MAWTLEDEIAWTERNPFRMHLGVAIERVSTDGSGDCEIALEINDNLVQAYGMVHGGIYCTLIDTVLGTAVRSAYQHDIGPLTIDLNVSFLRPAGKGRIYSSASIVKKGRQIVVGVADVFDAERRQLATGRGSFALRDQPRHRAD
ncbi:PaaI family thioesterase [Salinisphaera orenii]|uniref:PaaI family thioesterase n=1 Tax=Salinisphaera orenii TaxID=856731 RepID=UPI000F4A3D56|nr:MULTISPECIES: PaaI family thioesterase [Salinisphaera]